MTGHNNANVVQSEHSEIIGRRLYLNTERADVYFAVAISDQESVRVPAHKVFLESGSTVFRSMFNGEMREEGDIEITDATVAGLKEFLQTFYFSAVKLTIENIAEVMNLSEKYDVEACMQACEKLIRRNLTESNRNLLRAHRLAILFKRDELKAFLEEEIRQNPELLFDSDEFADCSQDALKSILEIKNLNCEPVDVLEACINWAIIRCNNANKEQTTENQRNELGDCFHLIPFDLMDTEDLSKCVLRYRGLFDRDELEDVIDMLTCDNPSELRKFKPKSFFIRWNDSAILTYRKDEAASSYVQPSHLDVKKMEIISFTVNQKMLFGSIEMNRIHLKYSLIRNSLFYSPKLIIGGVLMLIETAPNSIKKIILQEKIDQLNEITHMFNETILIKPNCLYDLQIIFDNTWEESRYETLRLMQHSSVKWGNNKIEFIGDSSNFVSTMHFNGYNKYKVWDKKWTNMLIAGATLYIVYKYLRSQM